MEPTPLEAKEPLFPKLAGQIALGFIALIGIGLLSSWWLPGLQWAIFGLVAIAILCLSAALAWRMAHLSRFRLRLDGEGIHDFRVGLRIPWSDVKDVWLYREDAALVHGLAGAAKFRLLLIRLRDPILYQDRISLLRRKFAKKYEVDLVLDLSSLDVSPETVESAARAFKGTS